MIYVIPTADLTNVLNINFGFGLFHFLHTADCYNVQWRHGTSRSIIYPLVGWQVAQPIAGNYGYKLNDPPHFWRALDIPCRRRRRLNSGYDHLA